MIYGTGEEDRLRNDSGVLELLPEKTVKTCFCGENHHHKLVWKQDSVVTSCGIESLFHKVSVLDPSETINVTKLNTPCGKTQKRGSDCVCPWGHYKVGGWFCVKQFNSFQEDRVVSI